MRCDCTDFTPKFSMEMVEMLRVSRGC
jgi:hypothetical protein